MNLCAAKPETRANAKDMLQKDLERMELLPGSYYNFHPGSHTGQGTEAGIAQIAQALGASLAGDADHRAAGDHGRQGLRDGRTL